MRLSMHRRWAALGLLLTVACAAPRTAGETIDGTYHAPSSRWSVDLPFEASVCRVEDQQFPAQENVVFTPDLPFDLGTYQIAVTHSAPPAQGDQDTDKTIWFDQLVQRMAESEGHQPRLIAEEHLSGDASECWMRIYEVDQRFMLFLLRPLPTLAADGVRGAVLFSLTCRPPGTRPPIGAEPPLALPLRGNWARFMEWSESFVWHASRPNSPW